MDDEDESKGFRQPKRCGEVGEELFVAKKLKKDLTKFTSSPSPSPAGERVHALTKQTPVRKDFSQSTSSPTGGEKIHAFIKQTLEANSQQILLEANSRQILANRRQTLEANSQQKTNSQQILANSRQILANGQHTLEANSQQKTNSRQIFANSQQILEANDQQTRANDQQILEANGQQNLANDQQILEANDQQILEANGQQKANSRQILQANSRQKGKNVAASTEEASRGPIYADICTETSWRPFVKNWYNNELKQRDKETWDKFDGCFKAIQTSNYKSANFWLSQLEKSHLSLQKKFGEVHQLVSRLVSFSSTSRSEWLKAKEKDLFSETSSEEQRNLKSIFPRLQTADLVNLRIEDFLELLNTLGVREDGVEELESKITVQDMINRYQQHLIDDNRLLVFFQQLEDSKKKNT